MLSNDQATIVRTIAHSDTTCRLGPFASDETGWNAWDYRDLDTYCSGIAAALWAAGLGTASDTDVRRAYEAAACESVFA